MKMERLAASVRDLLTVFVLAAGFCGSDVGAQAIAVKSSTAITSLPGVSPHPNDGFGEAVALLGDLDGNGVRDLAVGAWLDDDGGFDRGAVYVLFLGADGIPLASQKISSTAGGFSGQLDDADRFGRGVASIGDLDGDGVCDLAVTAPDDDDGGTDRGALWILFLNADGTVKGHSKISAVSGGFLAPLDDNDGWPTSVACVDDLDGDGVVDLITGTALDDDGGPNRGAVHVLFLTSVGTVKTYSKVSSVSAVPGISLDNQDEFGISVADVGSLPGGRRVAVGVKRDDDGAPDAGAVYVLDLGSTGEVMASHKISAFSGLGLSSLGANGIFGAAVHGAGDLDGNGANDLLVGSPLLGTGSVWFVGLDAVGAVDNVVQLPASQFGAASGGAVGLSIVSLGDMDSDGVQDIAVGSSIAASAGPVAGAVHIALMAGPATGAWAPIGDALEGLAGSPLLGGQGALAGGDLLSLRVSHAAPLALSFLVIGFDEVGLPFKGGVLVPAPTFLFTTTTDFFGELAFAGMWPTGVPSAFSTYFQFWITDATGPSGFAASNGLRGTTP